MAKNTKQIALMKQKSGKLNEIPKQLDDRVFGLAYDANRVFIGNLKSPALQERYESNTFPYGNLELLTEFAPLTDLIKYSPNMNGEKLYYTYEIKGDKEVTEPFENSCIKINNVEIYFSTIDEVKSFINNTFINIESEIIDNKIVIRTTADELILEDGERINEDIDYSGSLERIGLEYLFHPQTAITKRTLQDILDDRYSIKNFDVFGDNKHDDAEKINEAIKIISLFNKSDKKQLFFPANTYLVRKSINLMSDTYLKGEGIDRSIINLKLSDPLFVIDEKLNKNIVVEGFTFNIKESNAPEIINLANNFESVKFKNCKFICSTNSSILNNEPFENSSNLIFEDCIFDGNKSSNSALIINGNLNKFLITGCSFIDIPGFPINIIGGNDFIQNGIIANNNFENCSENDSKHTLIKIEGNTKYISVIKSFVEENYLSDNTNYIIMNRMIDEEGRFIDDNYCDTPFRTTDKNKYLRFNFYQSVYDYVQELYSKFGKKAIAVISPEDDEEILNYFQLKQGTNNNDLTIESINQIKDVNFNLGEFADLHLGKDSGIVDEWKPNKTYNVLEKIIYNNNEYRCIETHTSTENFDDSKWTSNIDIYDWTSNYSYNVNDWIYYNLKIYRCITNHISTLEFDTEKWEEIRDEYSKIVLHKQLDIHGESITSTIGNIVFKPIGDSVVEIDDDTYADKIAIHDNGVPTVKYVHKVLNPKNRIVLDSNIIDQKVSLSNTTEIDLFDFNRVDFGNTINLKNVSVNIRETFIPVSEQIMSEDPKKCSMLDWDNIIIYSNDIQNYSNVTWYLGDVVRTIFNNEERVYVCVEEHEASTKFITDDDGALISQSKTNKEKCFNDDLYKGYWKPILLDVTNTVNMLRDDGYDYTEIYNARYPDITFINYIGRSSSAQLPVIRNYIDAVPDVKYLSISSTDEDDNIKWLFELDDVNINKRNNGGYNYPYFEYNTIYKTNDIVRFNYSDYKCIIEDDNGNPTQYISGSEIEDEYDPHIELHDGSTWVRINTSGYDYTINFEKSLLEMDENGELVEEDYVLSHNFAGCKFKLGLFDKDKKPVILAEKSNMAEYLEYHDWQINETVYQGYYIKNNNKIYVANESYTTYGIVDEISNNLLTEINSKEWSIDGVYYINQYITNGSGDNLRYYHVIKNSNGLNYYKASDDIENDIENGYLEYIPSKYLQIGPSGQIIVTVNYDRG